MLDPEVVKTALLEYAEEHFEWGSFGEYMNYRSDQRGMVYAVPGLGRVVVIDYHDYDSSKNYDGWEEDLWIVFDVEGTLYRATGKYTSWSGSEWSDKVTVVAPVEKRIVVFEDVE